MVIGPTDTEMTQRGDWNEVVYNKETGSSLITFLVS